MKPWYSSPTLLGALSNIVPILAVLFQHQIAQYGLTDTVNQLVLMTLTGGAGAVYHGHAMNGVAVQQLTATQTALACPATSEVGPTSAPTGGAS